ncbi:MAG: metallopeptidase family protein [Ktedonobacterales bacterium]
MSSSNAYHPRGGTDPNQSNEPDYYAVLGVKSSASQREIKQEFRRLAKLWHPDHFTMAAPDLCARAERRMQSLNRAYQVLSDPVRKVAYDQSRLYPDDVLYETFATEPPDGWSGAMYGQPASGFPWGFPYRNSGYSWTQVAYDPANKPRQNNPNGAGMLGGTLCLILALGTLWRISTDGLVDGLLPILGLLAFVGLLILAGYLFDPKSPVARAVRRFLEYDPRLGWREYALRQHQRGENYGQSGEHAGPAGPEPTAFEQLVDEALSSIPTQFHSYLENLVVRVKSDPSPDEIARMKVRPCNLLLGLYEGIPLTYQGASGHPPEVITIFQHSIESYCHGDPDRIRHQVRATVFHELAHHFGMSHEEMPAWVK